VLLPRKRSKLAKGAKDKVHAMSQNLNSAIAFIGIDICENSFHVVSLDARCKLQFHALLLRGPAVDRE
jgi:hypothetical protein